VVAVVVVVAMKVAAAPLAVYYLDLLLFQEGVQLLLGLAQAALAQWAVAIQVRMYTQLQAHLVI
jgi:hypothetical protein